MCASLRSRRRKNTLGLKLELNLGSKKSWARSTFTFCFPFSGREQSPKNRQNWVDQFSKIFTPKKFLRKRSKLSFSAKIGPKMKICLSRISSWTCHLVTEDWSIFGSKVPGNYFTLKIFFFIWLSILFLFLNFLYSQLISHFIQGGYFRVRVAEWPRNN